MEPLRLQQGHRHTVSTISNDNEQSSPRCPMFFNRVTQRWEGGEEVDLAAFDETDDEADSDKAEVQPSRELSQAEAGALEAGEDDLTHLDPVIPTNRPTGHARFATSGPFLIRPMGVGADTMAGMMTVVRKLSSSGSKSGEKLEEPTTASVHFNPLSQRWEGDEVDLSGFESDGPVRDRDIGGSRGGHVDWEGAVITDDDAPEDVEPQSKPYRRQRGGRSYRDAEDDDDWGDGDATVPIVARLAAVPDHKPNQRSWEEREVEPSLPSTHVSGKILYRGQVASPRHKAPTSPAPVRNKAMDWLKDERRASRDSIASTDFDFDDEDETSPRDVPLEPKPLALSRQDSVGTSHGPKLIKPMGGGRGRPLGLTRQSSGVMNTAGSPDGSKMYYNPELQRWEGDDVDMTGFDDELGELPRAAASGAHATADAEPTTPGHRRHEGGKGTDSSSYLKIVAASELDKHKAQEVATELMEVFGCFEEKSASPSARPRKPGTVKRGPTVAGRDGHAAHKPGTRSQVGAQAKGSREGSMFGGKDGASRVRDRHAQKGKSIGVLHGYGPNSKDWSWTDAKLSESTGRGEDAGAMRNRAPSAPPRQRTSTAVDFMLSAEARRYFVLCEREHQDDIKAFLGLRLFAKAQKVGIERFIASTGQRLGSFSGADDQASVASRESTHEIQGSGHGGSKPAQGRSGHSELRRSAGGPASGRETVLRRSLVRSSSSDAVTRAARPPPSTAAMQPSARPNPSLTLKTGPVRAQPLAPREATKRPLSHHEQQPSTGAPPPPSTSFAATPPPPPPRPTTRTAAPTGRPRGGSGTLHGHKPTASTSTATMPSSGGSPAMGGGGGVSTSASINTALRRRLFSGAGSTAVGEGEQSRQKSRTLHAARTAPTIAVPNSTDPQTCAGSATAAEATPGRPLTPASEGGDVESHIEMPFPQPPPSELDRVNEIMEAAARQGWGLAPCLTDKHLDSLLKRRSEFSAAEQLHSHAGHTPHHTPHGSIARPLGWI